MPFDRAALSIFKRIAKPATYVAGASAPVACLAAITKGVVEVSVDTNNRSTQIGLLLDQVPEPVRDAVVTITETGAVYKLRKRASDDGIEARWWVYG